MMEKILGNKLALKSANKDGINLFCVKSPVAQKLP